MTSKKMQLPVLVSVSIKSCKKCPKFKQENPWSSDGWDYMVDWMCYGTKEPQKISGAVEWYEESSIEIPDWCPIRVSAPKETE